MMLRKTNLMLPNGNELVLYHSLGIETGGKVLKTFVVTTELAEALSMSQGGFRGWLSRNAVKTLESKATKQALGRRKKTRFLSRPELIRVFAAKYPDDASRLTSELEALLKPKAVAATQASVPPPLIPIDSFKSHIAVDVVSLSQTPAFVASLAEIPEVVAVGDVIVDNGPPPPILKPVPKPVVPEVQALLVPSRAWTKQDWWGKKYSLQLYDHSAALKNQLKELDRWLTKPHVSSRRAKAVTAVTAAKTLERIRCYMGFLKRAKCVERAPQLRLEAVLNNECVESYLDWLQAARGSSEGTRGQHLTALIAACKFLFRGASDAVRGGRDFSGVDAIVRYRDMRNSLASQASRKRKTRHDLEDEDRWVDMPAFRAGIDTLQAQCDMAEAGTRDQARLLHDLSLLQWQTLGPSRAGPLRTLEYWSWDELTATRGKLSVADWALENQINVLTKRRNETWTATLTNFKTARSKGVDVTEIDAEQFPSLCANLDTYLIGDKSLRGLLQPVADHRNVFMTTAGTQLTETYFSRYYGTLLQRYTGVSRATASTVRSSFITEFLESDAGADMRNREALSELMRHSIKHQSESYDRRMPQAKKARALQVLAEEPSVEASEAMPFFAPNDVIAIVTPEQHTFQLAKIIRVNGPQALVMQTTLVATASYQFNPRATRIVSLANSMHIDAVWDGQTRSYVLRTAAHDILQQ